VILDEPTTGLHMADVAGLRSDSLDRMVDNGSTVIVIEHNLDVVARADWVLDMGPGAGNEGGNIVFEGGPAKLLNHASSAHRPTPGETRSVNLRARFPSSLRMGYIAKHSDETTMKRSGAGHEGESASQLITEKIADLGDWRGDMLGRNPRADQAGRPRHRRGVEVDGNPGLVARWDGLHWRDIQERREDDVRQGRLSEGPSGLFNSSLDGNLRRAIDIHEGEKIAAPALKALIRDAWR